MTRLVDSRDRSWPTYYADGWGRQYILVIPGLDLVVVSVSDDYDYDGPGTGTLLRERVLPALEPVTPVFEMNAGLNDAWVNSGAPLQGLFVTVFPVLKRVFLGWFSFDSELPTEPAMAVFGASDQRWVTAAGMFNGNRAELKVEFTTGGLFNTAEPMATQDTGYGTINLEFTNCQQGTVEFDFPSTGQSGSFNIQRVADSNVALCEALDASPE